MANCEWCRRPLAAGSSEHRRYCDGICADNHQAFEKAEAMLKMPTYPGSKEIRYEANDVGQDMEFEPPVWTGTLDKFAADNPEIALPAPDEDGSILIDLGTDGTYRLVPIF